METNDYITSGDFTSLTNDLTSRSCKIAFLGNSITAQKNGYTKFLQEKIDKISGLNHKYIHAGLGGVGSLASCFILDDFVIRHKPNICFVECTVADIGSATPISYIESSLSGIIEKLLLVDIKICFLHLYCSHTSLHKKKEVINEYEKIITYYGLPAINLNHKISNLINSQSIIEDDVLYDGVHTTLQGANLYASEIINVLFAKRERDLLFGVNAEFKTLLTQKAFIHSQIVIPPYLLLDQSTDVNKCRFRGLIKYLKIKPHYIISYSQNIGKIVGFFIIADNESGVLFVQYSSQSIYIQTSDIWCDKERIQAVILEKPVLEREKLSITLTSNDIGSCGANGMQNLTKKVGISFKLIGLMVVSNVKPIKTFTLW